MRKMSLAKVIGILVTVAGAGLTLIGNWADDKLLDERIEEKLAERCSEKERSNG